MHLRSFSPALLATVLLASVAAPAQAADTPISLTVEAGPLSISAPATFELDALNPGSTASFLQGALPTCVPERLAGLPLRR